MMQTETRTDVSSEKYEHGNTCGLFDARHTISAEIDGVLSGLDDMDGFEVVAGGCNGCTTHELAHNHDADAYVYYIAQGGDSERLFVGYGASDDAQIDMESVAYTVIGACVENGVQWDWDGDTGSKVLIGDSDYYDN